MNFWRLVSPDTLDVPIITGHHDHWVMLVGSLLAILAAWVLLPVTDRYNALTGRMRWFWLGAGSVAMGIGIWAMHFTSMLAFHLPFAIDYDLSVTLVSIVPAVLASATSIMLFAAAGKSHLRLNQAALCLALGIGSMHYLGMESIEVPARMHYRPGLFALSIAAAYLLALTGLHGKIRASRMPGVPRYLGNLAGSLTLGLAVTSMHTFAMRATYFVADGQGDIQRFSVMDGLHVVPGSGLYIGIIICTLLLLGFIFLGTLVDRRMSLMATSLQQSELRFQRLAETTQMAIFAFHEDRITYANPALATITGYDSDKLLTLSLQQIFGTAFHEFAVGILQSGLPFGEARYALFEILNQQGESRWLYFSVTLAEIDHQSACLASACDISEQKRAELMLHRLAYTDQLTGLGNRTMFIDRLQHHLDLLARRKHAGFSCVMLLDLDGFKLINDNYGHMLGDRLLQDVAARLQPIARQCDSLARLGGDEFVLLVEDMSNARNAGLIARRILQELARPFLVSDRELTINGSIGLTLLDAVTCRTPDQVLHDVDVALYRAKDQGKGCWVLYDEEIDAHVKRARQLQVELREALGKGQLQLYYQPIFQAPGDSLCGFEALARWQREDGEWVSPAEFIPLAEESGLIKDITCWAIDKAIEQIHAWNRLHIHTHFYVSVNVASASFDDERFFGLIAEAFARRRIDPGQLKLELTERMLVSDNQSMLLKLNKLIELGCELMIDDFGTGYSSLAYLHRLPVKTLKIDRTFVTNLESDEGSVSVVNSIIALARALDMDVISEGVENVMQARLLTELGATHLQGYLLGRPMQAEAATALILPSMREALLA